jgi:hypothetical protein
VGFYNGRTKTLDSARERGTHLRCLMRDCVRSCTRLESRVGRVEASLFSAHCSCSLKFLSAGAIAGLVNNGTTSKPVVGDDAGLITLGQGMACGRLRTWQNARSG